MEQRFFVRHRSGFSWLADQGSRMVNKFWLDDVTDLATCVADQQNVSDMSACEVDAAILRCRPIFHGGEEHQKSGTSKKP
jgi:hypothetical protein